jgi:hypothetical protein
MTSSAKAKFLTIHLRGINASEQKYYINKGTSTYCPFGIENLDCSKSTSASQFSSISNQILPAGNLTVFGFNSSTSALGMNVQVPGG